MTTTRDSQLAIVGNGCSIDRSNVPALPVGEFRQHILESAAEGHRIAAMFASPEPGNATIRLWVVLADDAQSRLGIATTAPMAEDYESLTTACPQAHLFEREIAEQFGVRPNGHPWLKPVRFHRSYRPGHDVFADTNGTAPTIGVTDFYQVKGDEVHEVAVGPVHAGVIEPGHFRFQCHGEDVYHLEISLGYQHRGVERAMIGGPGKRAIHYMQTLAGDTSIGHSEAYCQILEALAGSEEPPRAQSIRAIALELERLANHVGDLGALANDVAFLPTASYCGRLRGDILNMTALLCGNRFGRGLVRPGGVAFDLDQEMVDELLRRLAACERDCRIAVNLLWDSPSVMARFEEMGTVSASTAEAIGLVGPAARGAGLSRDVRLDHPSGLYRFTHIPVATCNTGDVFARAYVRWLEVQRSFTFVEEQVRTLPSGPIHERLEATRPNQVAVALVEGWRGELCHVAITDSQGRFLRYKIVDPSFHNWTGLAMALRNQRISDFPLCNKSFNLSYCGHDL